MLERVMERSPKPSRKRTPPLEVHVMFEPNRFAQQCLADAYACLLPTVRRRLGQAQPPVKPAQISAERNAQ